MSKKNKINLWSIYHENTKHFSHIIHKKPLSEGELAELMLKGKKSYPIASKIKLKSPKENRKVSLEKVLTKRRSTRTFSKKPIPVSKISQLLQLSYGVSGSSSITSNNETHSYELRSAPSAGALYSCEVYLVALNVKSIERGVYHYLPEASELEKLKSNGNLEELIHEGIIDPKQFQNWSAALIISGSFIKAVTKYGERGYRYVLLDAGHIGQNIYLVGTSLKLGVVGVCGFYDDKVNKLLFLDGQNESSLYIMLLGLIDKHTNLVPHTLDRDY
jgi:SagB-type dehydrogenase family enzyme